MALPSPARISPGRLLLAGALVCAFFCGLSIWLALNQPWMGLSLRPDFDTGVVHIDKARGPSAHLSLPAELVSLRAASSEAALPVHAIDLIEESDHIDSFAEIDALFLRQTAMASALRDGAIVLELRDPMGLTRSHRVEPISRPLSSLPAVFWFQLFAGSTSFLIGLWVLVLRPGDWGARLFALMSAFLPCATFSAAVYSTREIAIDGGLFRALTAVNHAGSVLFGAALVALFASFPKQLVPPHQLWSIPAVFVPWIAINVLHLAPSQGIALHLAVLVEMLLALGLSVVQWRVTRDDPHARAAFRWLGLSILMGCSLWAFFNTGANLLNWFRPLPQGYSFGLFLLMDVGLALGLRRHRLFELEEWAYRILFWVLGALGLIVLDVVLIVVLRADPTLSLSVSLLVMGFVYLPIRNWLWSTTISGRRIETHELFQDVLQVAFAASAAERRRSWRELLRKFFNPLEIHPVHDVAIEAVVIGNDGLRLDLPKVASSPAMRLEYPWGGRGLFGPRHLRLATHLVTLMRHAEKSRDAYDRGVKDERHRIARDLHDDIGARLLGGLHSKTLEDSRQTIRHAIFDMRTIVTELTDRETSLRDMLADLRYETSARLEDAGLDVHWPVREHDPAFVLDAHVHKQYLSMFRELISNIIRHAEATRVSILVESGPGRFVTTISDDGVGLGRESAGSGHGLRNLDERTSELGGTISFQSDAGETRVVLDLPSRRGSTASIAL